MQKMLASASIDISELKVNPSAAIDNANGPIAVLNGNAAVAYLVPPAEWERICDVLEDVELTAIVRNRVGETPINVSLEDV
jgi:antitoxin StbD